MARPEEDHLDALPRARRVGGWERLWRPFWVLPMVLVAAATVSGLLLPEVDRVLDRHLPYVFPGGPSGARDVLGTIAGAMISVTGLVFSITMVVIQLASSQYSPRVLNDFLSNRTTQVTLGIFAASFTYALAVLRSVQGESGEQDIFVPQISVTVGFLLVLASVAMFLAFIHHITRSIQVSSILTHLGDTTMEVIDHYLPEPGGAATPPVAESWDAPPGHIPHLVTAGAPGVLAEVNHRRLIRWAVDNDAVVEVLPQVGDFVTEQAPTARVWRAGGSEQQDDDDLKGVSRCLRVEKDRQFLQDPGSGVRKLVDIAERALSTGLNDPTTAVQALDQLHRVLRRAVTRTDLPALVPVDGETRLVHRPQTVRQLVDLALEEVLHHGGDSLQVTRRVVDLLDDLIRVSLPAHRPHLLSWRARAQPAAAAAERRAVRGPVGGAP